MKVLVVMTMELPFPEAITDVLDHLDPPTIPGFAGAIRVVVEPHATAVEKWLDED